MLQAVKCKDTNKKYLINTIKIPKLEMKISRLTRKIQNSKEKYINQTQLILIPIKFKKKIKLLKIKICKIKKKLKRKVKNWVKFNFNQIILIENVAINRNNIKRLLKNQNSKSNPTKS